MRILSLAFAMVACAGAAVAQGPRTATECFKKVRTARDASGKPVVLSTRELDQMAIERVMPTPKYMAMQARIFGSVRLKILVNDAGIVECVSVVAGHPLLIPSSLEAITKWRFRPYMQNGRAVAVLGVIAFRFADTEVSVGKIRALIIDGQNNHKWQETTPILEKILEDSHLFVVTVATAPPGPDMSGFHPDFAGFDVVVSNYNGLAWPDDTKAAFEKYVRDGGGFVSYHAADNAFPDWPAYNEMIGVGGWAGRKNAAGKACGHHGDRLPFQVTVRDAASPIAQGLPTAWMHAPDELYDTLCGPAKDVDTVATAHSDPANKGTNENEPMLMTLRYGKGRVFHTTLGHDVAAMQSVDFIVTFARGAEWAATGKVTQKVPDDFPDADHVRLRK